MLFENMLYIAIWIFIIILISGILLIFKFKKKKGKLSSEKIIFFEKHLKKISLWIDSKTKIIDYDKLYHKILNELWYEGSFWDILKIKPEEISDLDKIWKLHKLRNKLVHDFDLLEEVILRKKSKEYETEIKKIINN